MRFLIGFRKKVGDFSSEMGNFFVGAVVFLLGVPILGHILRVIAIPITYFVCCCWALMRVVGKISARKLRRVLFQFIKTRNFSSLGRVIKRVFTGEFLKMDQKVPLYVFIDLLALLPFAA